jgi:hypothetical protein
LMYLIIKPPEIVLLNTRAVFPGQSWLETLSNGVVSYRDFFHFLRTSSYGVRIGLIF